MKPRFLLDEHLAPAIKEQLQRREAAIEVLCIGDVSAPPRSTLDPDILIWIEQHHYILITNNRKTMPTHLSDHLLAGRDFPGILLINEGTSIGELVLELLLIWATSEAEEYNGLIQSIPL